MSLSRAALGAALVATIVAAFPNARAGDVSFDKVPPNYTMLMKMKPMDVMHAMDPDKKGYVTKEDYMKFHEMMFQKMDKNHDNRLDEDEFLQGTRREP
jgi:hypothetical protein